MLFGSLILCDVEVNGRKSRGRPRKTWNNEVIRIATKRNFYDNITILALKLGSPSLLEFTTLT